MQERFSRGATYCGMCRVLEEFSFEGGSLTAPNGCTTTEDNVSKAVRPMADKPRGLNKREYTTGILHGGVLYSCLVGQTGHLRD